MNYFGGGTGCCSWNSGNQFVPFTTFGGCGCGCGSNFGIGGCNNSSYYAIILVLFILLVIVIGSRYSR